MPSSTRTAPTPSTWATGLPPSVTASVAAGRQVHRGPRIGRDLHVQVEARSVDHLPLAGDRSANRVVARLEPGEIAARARPDHEALVAGIVRVGIDTRELPPYPLAYRAETEVVQRVHDGMLVAAPAPRGPRRRHPTVPRSWLHSGRPCTPTRARYAGSSAAKPHRDGRCASTPAACDGWRGCRSTDARGTCRSPPAGAALPARATPRRADRNAGPVHSRPACRRSRDHRQPRTHG